MLGAKEPSQAYIYPSPLALLSELHTYLATEFLAHKEGVLKETTFIAQRMVGDFAKGLRAFWVVQFLIYPLAVMVLSCSFFFTECLGAAEASKKMGGEFIVNIVGNLIVCVWVVLRKRGKKKPS